MSLVTSSDWLHTTILVTKFRSFFKVVTSVTSVTSVTGSTLACVQRKHHRDRPLSPAPSFVRMYTILVTLVTTLFSQGNLVTSTIIGLVTSWLQTATKAEKGRPI